MFYYAEISLRRLVNQALRIAYSGGIQQWIKRPEESLKMCIDSFEPISIWHSHLPANMQCVDGAPTNDLALYLRVNYLQATEMLHRPIVYGVLHKSNFGQRHPQAISTVHRYLETCSELILHCRNLPRYGGMWGMLRATFGASVAILAVVVCGGGIAYPHNWRQLVELSINTLLNWSNEAPDIGWMGTVLENMLTEVIGTCL